MGTILLQSPLQTTSGLIITWPAWSKIDQCLQSLKQLVYRGLELTNSKIFRPGIRYTVQLTHELQLRNQILVLLQSLANNHVWTIVSLNQRSQLCLKYLELPDSVIDNIAHLLRKVMPGYYVT